MDKGKKHKTQEAEKAQGGVQPGMQDCECFCGEDLKKEKPEAPKKAAAEETAKESRDYYQQLVQLKADFENYRKRMEKERPALISWGKSEAILKFLPLYDLLLAANRHVGKLQEGEGAGQVEDVAKGLEMIFKEFSKVFDAEGIRPMETVGKPFDPMGTEILSVIDGDDSNDGLVMEELQKGFYYGDKVLRPARVKIAKKKEPAEKAGPLPEDTAGENKQQGKP